MITLVVGLLVTVVVVGAMVAWYLREERRRAGEER
jgi:putative effector of murein hydrolase LrgA (UPF0299 family)